MPRHWGVLIIPVGRGDQIGRELGVEGFDREAVLVLGACSLYHPRFAGALSFIILHESCFFRLAAAVIILYNRF